MASHQMCAFISQVMEEHVFKNVFPPAAFHTSDAKIVATPVPKGNRFTNYFSFIMWKK